MNWLKIYSRIDSWVDVRFFFCCVVKVTIGDIHACRDIFRNITVNCSDQLKPIALFPTGIIHKIHVCGMSPFVFKMLQSHTNSLFCIIFGTVVIGIADMLIDTTYFIILINFIITCHTRSIVNLAIRGFCFTKIGISCTNIICICVFLDKQ